MKTWTPTEVDEIRDMVLVQHKTYSEVAAFLSVTRSQIAGLCKRNGIKHPTPPERRRHVPKPKRAMEYTPQKTVFELQPKSEPLPLLKSECWNPLPGLEPVHITSLRYHQCRWPVTETHGLSCGAEVHSGVYCETHRRVAYKEQATA